jgi:hypothetical protein
MVDSTATLKSSVIKYAILSRRIFELHKTNIQLHKNINKLISYTFYLTHHVPLVGKFQSQLMYVVLSHYRIYFKM